MMNYDLFAKKIQVEIHDQSVTLSERSIKDQRELAEAVKGQDLKNDQNIMIAATFAMIRDGLQINIRRLKFWQIIKKRQLNKLFSNNSLFLLPGSLISDMVKQLEEWEGTTEDEKKKKEQPLTGQPPIVSLVTPETSP